MPSLAIREATDADIDWLVDLEAESFAADRLSPRSFRRLIAAKSAALRVASHKASRAGYALILFRAGTGIGRIYSIAVAPAFRGQGIAEALMRDAERVTRRGGRHTVRLEVREDNQPAIRLYQRLGYAQIGRYSDYYADHAAALRFEKRVAPLAGGMRRKAKGTRSPRDSARRSPYIGRVWRPKPAGKGAAEPAVAERVPPPSL